MKIILRLALFSTLCLAAFSCSSQKNTATVSQNSNSTATSTPITSQPTPSTTVPLAQGTTRFIVSFFSIGEGIDVKTHNEFVDFLNTYSPKIEYSPARWGREGEKDYCLGLTELSATQQTEFIKKANAILAKSKLVNVNENTKCEHASASVTPAPTEDTYRLVVSFYSNGEGIDVKTKEEYVRFLNNYTKKIAFEPTRWGREGETDYCLKLNELSETDQSEFVKKSKELLNKSTLVHVDENAKCVHKH